VRLVADMLPIRDESIHAAIVGMGNRDMTIEFGDEGTLRYLNYAKSVSIDLIAKTSGSTYTFTQPSITFHYMAVSAIHACGHKLNWRYQKDL